MKREWTIDLVWGIVGGIITVLVTAYFMGCFPNETTLEGGKYATNLEECNRTAKTLCDSIKCENEWRARAGRLPRDMPKHCQSFDKAELKTLLESIKDAGGE